ncbi:MAG: hypothetical protein IKK93_00425 [Campylobacter sp.]|nr:hypothetical protein [Campylobacter sp.]
MEEDKVYIVWEIDEEEKNLIDIYKSKKKAQKEADRLRHQILNDMENDDDSIDYFVEGKDLK